MIFFVKIKSAIIFKNLFLQGGGLKMLIWNLKQKSYFDEGLVDTVRSNGILLLDMNKINQLPPWRRREYRDYMFFVLGGCRVDTYNETIYYKKSENQILVGIYDFESEACVTAVILSDDCLDNNKVKNIIYKFVKLY